MMSREEPRGSVAASGGGLTQRGFEGQWFADSWMLDSHAPDSETSCTVASLAAVLHLRDGDKDQPAHSSMTLWQICAARFHIG